MMLCRCTILTVKVLNVIKFVGLVHLGKHGGQFGIISGASDIPAIWWLCRGYFPLPGVTENVVEGDCVPRVVAVEIVI